MISLGRQITEIQKPLKECPVCGMSDIKTKESFKGRLNFRNKRKTQYCKCGWSRIIPTLREAETELGLHDSE